jgi:hypothetical protein
MMGVQRREKKQWIDNNGSLLLFLACPSQRLNEFNRNQLFGLGRESMKYLTKQAHAKSGLIDRDRRGVGWVAVSGRFCGVRSSASCLLLPRRAQRLACSHECSNDARN